MAEVKASLCSRDMALSRQLRSLTSYPVSCDHSFIFFALYFVAFCVFSMSLPLSLGLHNLLFTTAVEIKVTII